MKLQELLRAFNFKGSVRIYSFDSDSDKSTDYVRNSSIEELMFGNENLNTDVAIYETFLKDIEVKYASIHLNEAWLELWICIEKVFK